MQHQLSLREPQGNQHRLLLWQREVRLRFQPKVRFCKDRGADISQKCQSKPSEYVSDERVRTPNLKCKHYNCYANHDPRNRNRTMRLSAAAIPPMSAPASMVFPIKTPISAK